MQLWYHSFAQTVDELEYCQVLEAIALFGIDYISQGPADGSEWWYRKAILVYCLRLKVYSNLDWNFGRWSDLECLIRKLNVFVTTDRNVHSTPGINIEMIIETERVASA